MALASSTRLDVVGDVRHHGAHLLSGAASQAESIPASPASDQDAGESVPSVVSSEAQLRAWAEALAIPLWTNLADRPPHWGFLERVPIGFARQYALMGFGNTAAVSGDDTVFLALGSPEHWPQVDVLRRFLKRPVQPVLAAEEQILTAINRAYQQRSGQAASLVEVLDAKEMGDDLESELADREDLLESRGSPPIIRLVNSILFEGVKARASDVHVQPQEDSVVVRQRIDGVLFDTLKIPKSYQEEVISRLKVLGRMNIAEKRLPQDGRATVQLGERLVDLRIASLPTSCGERVVVRFLDKSARLYTLNELGMSAGNLQGFRALIKRDHGILLATGPTGAGKSTTLYAALQEIDAKNLNVLTLEDPIEYQLAGISQTQINQKKGLTFASGLRNVLRQDPDIIMVGEIRDHETAAMAIQSALTGHLVFSTLHTNDAASAVTRLLDLGIEPYLVASSVIGVIAQRLVRSICPQCKKAVVVSEEQLHRLGLDGGQLAGRKLYRGRGCDACRQRGYSGRVGIFEVLCVNDSVRELVQARANASQIRSRACHEGMALLRHDGLAKAFAGETAVEEVLRVTAED
jgi:general secretion pathway protein E